MFLLVLIVAVILYVASFIWIDAEMRRQFGAECAEMIQFTPEWSRVSTVCIHVLTIWPRPMWICVRPCLTAQDIRDANPHLFGGSSVRRGGSVLLHDILECPHCHTKMRTYDHLIWLPNDGFIYDLRGEVRMDLQGRRFVVTASLVHVRDIPPTLACVFYPIFYIASTWISRIQRPWSGNQQGRVHYCNSCSTILTPFTQTPLRLNRVYRDPESYATPLSTWILHASSSSA